MGDNRYSPPSAPVSDFESPGSLERPVTVARAVYLLWASLALSVVAIIHESLQPEEGVSMGEVLVVAAVVLALAAALAIWLNTAAWKGRGYARWVLAVLTVLGFVFLLLLERFAPDIPDPVWYIQIIDFVSWITAVVGNGMLFAPSANTWYRAMRANRLAGAAG